MRICKKCGTEVEKMYCPDCGTRFEEETEEKTVIAADYRVENLSAAEPVSQVEEVIEPQVEEPIEPQVEETDVPLEEARYEVRQELAPVTYAEKESRRDGRDGTLSAKTTGIIAYITWVGLILAFIIGDRDGAKFHLNQALVITLTSAIINFVGAWIPVLGGLLVAVGGLFTLVCWGLGLYYACIGQEKEVPLLGQIRLLY